MKKTLGILFMLSLILVIGFGTVQANAQAFRAYCWEICDCFNPSTEECYRGGGFGADPYNPYDLTIVTCETWCP